MKKTITILILLFNFSFCAFSSDYDTISAGSAIVINAETKEVLYEKNAYQKRSMASTTKIMTSILAIESGRLSDEVSFVAEAITEGSSMGLKEGYVLTLESLVYGMMLDSGNDAANLCALYLSGSFGSFSEFMNEKAAEIGMCNTNFVTPSGLDAEDHYSTAYDMALLGAYCIENPLFRRICATENHSVALVEPDISLQLENHNRLLNDCNGVFGIKTGFTKKSGRCLVTACQREGATLICVTLNAGDDWNDHKKLYDWCFADLNKKTVRPLSFDSIRIYGAEKERISVYCEDYTHYYKSSFSEIQTEIYLDQIIYAPVSENEVLGRVVYFSEGDYIGESYIYSAESVHCKEPSYKERLPFAEWIKNIFK